MKPRLPDEIEARLPPDLVRHIYRFIPHTVKKTPPPRPDVQRELKKLYSSPKLTAMAFYGLDDFVLG